MDKRNYDQRTIGIFEIVGAYFVDVYYNNHYLNAVASTRKQQTKNVTSAYQINVSNFVRGVADSDKAFRMVVRSLHEYYQRTSGFSSAMLVEFQDKFVSQFIPPEYFGDFTETLKDRTMRDILIHTAREFAAVVLDRDNLMRIIDDHKNYENVNILQDRIMDVLLMQREDYYAKFAQEISKKGVTDYVSRDILEKLKAAFIEEKKRVLSLERDRALAINMIQQLTQRVNVLEAELRNVRAPVAPAPLREEVIATPPKPSAEDVSSFWEPPKRAKTPYPSNEPSSSSSESLDEDEVRERQRQAILNRPKKQVDITLDSPEGISPLV